MTPRFQFPCLVLGGLAVASSCVFAAETFPPEQIEFFEKNIRPVLAERCYGFLQRNAASADRHFGIPFKQVVELGTQLDL